MTNTERLIYSLRCAIKSGASHVDFMVGRYTGNGPAVVAALRRRGFVVSKNRQIGVCSYRLESPAPKRFLVGYGSKLFSGHRVIEAESADAARAVVEAEGYKVKTVVEIEGGEE